MCNIYTIIKTTSEFRNVSVTVTLTAVGVVEMGVVDTRYGVSQPGADAERQRCACLHMHVSVITYRVDVYRSRPICASLLSTSPQQGCLALKGLHTGWLGVHGDGYPLNTDLDWGLSSVNYPQ